MKLRQKLPRLSRKQKIIRNLLAAVVAVFLLWMVDDFQAPTSGLVLRWELESYGLEVDEVLYREEFSEGQRSVVFRAGKYYGTALEQKSGLLGRVIHQVHLKEPTEPVSILQEPGSFYREPLSVFAVADIPGAARAVCSLRLRGSIYTSITAEDVRVADEHYNWDETYTMEAVPTEQNVYRFILQRKNPKDWEAGYREQTKQMAEESMFNNFQWITKNSADRDFVCDLTVTFYDAAGNEVDTYEETLWEKTK